VKHWFEEKQYSLTFKARQKSNSEIIPDTLDFIGYNYGDPIPDLSEYDKVIICDVSFPMEIIINLHEKLKHNFIILDHHKSFIEDIPRGLCLHGILNWDYAACELTWKYFFPEPDGADYHSAHIPSNLKGENIPLPKNEMPEIVRLLGMYDSFRHKGTNEEQKVLEFQYGARQVISNYEEAYNCLIASIENKSVYGFEITEKQTLERYIHKKGIIIYQYLCTEAKQVYKNGFPIRIVIPGPSPTYKFICINKERFNPTNFGIDYHAEGYNGAACFWYSNGKWQFSLYNDNGKVDCSVIAKSFGGGGDCGAAGFVCDTEQLLKIIT
ncbi:MAG: hypothetical protein WCV43_06045, partial [Candidatus Caldatribacteriota bacterium]